MAQVEVTSEDAGYPIEPALLPGRESGWRAADPGEQTIRLIFDQPLRLQRMRLHVIEPAAEPTQEIVLRWSADGGRSFRDLLRQQYAFSPRGRPRHQARRFMRGVEVLVLDQALARLAELDWRKSQLVELRYFGGLDRGGGGRARYPRLRRSSDAVIRGAEDDLLGLEENIIIGHLIPVGSGIYRYAEIDIQPPAGYEAPPPRVEVPVPVPVLTAAALIGEEE